jgi:hypothetical protein
LPNTRGFVFDTNVFIAAWNVHYRPEQFGPVWRLIEGCLEDGRIKAPRAVFVELTGTHDDGIAAWARERAPHFAHPPEEVQRLIATIDAAAPGLIKPTTRNAADPWVIALALHEQRTVVTYEGIGPTGIAATGKGMQIPRACAALGVECIILADAFVRLGLAG